MDLSRSLVALASALSIAVPALAEEATTPGPWKLGAVVGLNLSQSSFTDNWAGGDKGSINWALNADLDAQRQMSHSFHWSNLLQLAYGQTAKEELAADGTKRWTTPDKTTDLILFESVGRFTLDAFADPYVAVRVDGQFSDESDPFGRSITLNPITLSETAGLARVFQKEEDREFISRLGFGLRQNFGRTFADSIGDATNSFTTNDGGLEFQTEALYPLLDGKVRYRGKLLVFYSVFFDRSDDLKDFDEAAIAADPTREEVADFWRVPDVNFQNSFDSKITDWLSVNLYLQWVYDKFDAATNVDPSQPLDAQIAEIDSGIRKGGQFKQTLAIGLSYRFL